jgi:hypothetical protein
VTLESDHGRLTRCLGCKFGMTRIEWPSAVGGRGLLLTLSKIPDPFRGVGERLVCCQANLHP